MTKTRSVLLMAALALGLGAAPAFAKQDSHDEGKGKGHNKNKNKHGDAHKVYFNDSHRGYATTYYREEYRGGHCPPGLAKKHNGCMPPGQAKQWKLGQPLPAKIVMYELPPTLVVKIGAPPAGYKYVRVAADILLIAVGTSIVVDAINDLGRI